MTNQEKRELLRDLRRNLAELNDITALSSTRPCAEDCAGTCSSCEAELRWLETELNRRAAQGKPIRLCGCTTAVPVAEVVTPIASQPSSSPSGRFDMSLEELGLSLRTRVSLDGHGITGVRQLLSMSPSDLKKVRNMTQEGLDEIEFQLGLLGLSLENDC